MPHDPNRTAHDFEVHDAATAFRRLQDLGRRVLATPKKTVDQKLAKEKSAKKRRRH